jgi:hypothetical protein
LVQEKDHGLRVAYAASLGQLQDASVTPTLLTLLAQETEPMAQAEIALALARLIGNETRYVQMLRQTRVDLDTAASQIVLGLNKKWPALSESIAKCARAFSLGRHDEAITELVELTAAILEDPLPQPDYKILQECLIRLPQFGKSRKEYLLLLLHGLSAVE